MVVVALAMGRSKRGLGRPRAFSFRAPSKINQREEKAEEDTAWNVSLAAVPMKLLDRN